MRIMFSKLRLQLHPEKCFFEGINSLEILGIVVDTNLRQFLLSPKKLARVEKAARRLLAHVTRHRRCVRIKDLRRFTGIANATGPAVTDARLRLREMFDALSLASRVTRIIGNIENTTQSPPSHHVTLSSATHHAPPQETSFAGVKRYCRHTPVTQARLSHAAVRDLLWWARLSQNPHIGRHIWPHLEACLFTDASTGGWGAAWKGSVPASRFFGPEHEGSHINELEVTAALLALHNFVAYARNLQVQLITDSLVTAHIVRSMTSRYPRLPFKLRELRQLREKHDVTLSTRHLPSVLMLGRLPLPQARQPCLAASFRGPVAPRAKVSQAFATRGQPQATRSQAYNPSATGFTPSFTPRRLGTPLRPTRLRRPSRPGLARATVVPGGLPRRSMHPLTQHSHISVGDLRLSVQDEAAAVSWHHQGTHGAAILLGSRQGAAAGPYLLRRTLACSTQTGYQQH